MGTRTKDRRAARELTLEILYQAEIREQLPGEVLQARRDGKWSVPGGDTDTGRSAPSDATIDYTTRLVEGVQSHLAAIDATIDRFAVRWDLGRMPVVDKNLLRIATFEIIWAPDVPVAVVINEAIELAKAMSTETSAGFVNGVLGAIAASGLRETDG